MRFAMSCMAGVPVSRESTFLANHAANRMATTPQMSTGSEYNVRSSKTPSPSRSRTWAGKPSAEYPFLQRDWSAHAAVDLELQNATASPAIYRRQKVATLGDTRSASLPRADRKRFVEF